MRVSAINRICIFIPIIFSKSPLNAPEKEQAKVYKSFILILNMANELKKKSSCEECEECEEEIEDEDFGEEEDTEISEEE